MVWVLLIVVSVGSKASTQVEVKVYESEVSCRRDKDNFEENFRPLYTEISVKCEKIKVLK